MAPTNPLGDEERVAKPKRSGQHHKSIDLQTYTTAVRSQTSKLQSRRLHYDWVDIAGSIDITSKQPRVKTPSDPRKPEHANDKERHVDLDATICVYILPLDTQLDVDVKPNVEGHTICDDYIVGDSGDEEKDVKVTDDRNNDPVLVPDDKDNEMFEKYGFVWVNNRYEVLKPQAPLLYIKGPDSQGPWRIDKIENEKRADGVDLLKITCSSTFLSTIQGESLGVGEGVREGVALVDEDFSEDNGHKGVIHYMSFRKDDVKKARELNDKWKFGRLCVLRPLSLFARMTVYSLNAMNTVEQVSFKWLMLSSLCIF